MISRCTNSKHSRYLTEPPWVQALLCYCLTKYYNCHQTKNSHLKELTTVDLLHRCFPSTTSCTGFILWNSTLSSCCERFLNHKIDCFCKLDSSISQHFRQSNLLQVLGLLLMCKGYEAKLEQTNKTRGFSIAKFAFCLMRDLVNQSVEWIVTRF